MAISFEATQYICIYTHTYRHIHIQYIYIYVYIDLSLLLFRSILLLLLGQGRLAAACEWRASSVLGLRAVSAALLRTRLRQESLALGSEERLLLRSLPLTLPVLRLLRLLLVLRLLLPTVQLPRRGARV